MLAVAYNFYASSKIKYLLNHRLSVARAVECDDTHTQMEALCRTIHHKYGAHFVENHVGNLTILARVGSPGPG